MDDKNFLNLLKGVEGYDDNLNVKTGFIDSGCYALNALISGSIWGGFPDNRIVGLAGDPATGKSYLSYGIIREFLDNHENGRVILFDSEIAIDKDDLAERGIDIKRLTILYPETLEQFRTQSSQILDGFSKFKPADKFPLMFVLDSLSNLASNKEVSDAQEDKQTADMTRAKVIRSIFRILAAKCGKNRIPLIVTNHTYENIMNMYAGKEVAGGGGLKYGASTIVMLSKAKDQDADKDVIGLTITAKTYKSRFTKPEKKVKLNLSFDHGLSKFHGLLEIAEDYGIFPKEGNKYVIGENKFFGKSIMKDPERFFTDEVLLKIDEACKKEFKFGGGDDQQVDDEDEENEEELAE